MKKYIADCSAGGKAGGKKQSANLQAILKVRSGVERYCAYCGMLRFFRENVASFGVCNGDCPSRNLNYKQHINWRKTKPSEREMKHFIFAQSKTMYQCINCKQIIIHHYSNCSGTRSSNCVDEHAAAVVFETAADSVAVVRQARPPVGSFSTSEVLRVFTVCSSRSC
eukprot:scaffold13326_cov204-Alexandrium_tamarense.AAC.57